jgi:CRP/FNR family transcriptional regulator/CRP/FNR family cyclic AMP-dependent transcriptional regulator
MLPRMASSLRERQEILAAVEIFGRCKKRDIRALAKACQERVYPRGTALCRQGHRGVAMFVIISGEVRVEEELADGRAVLVARLGPGAAVGEMAIIDGAERTASVVADTDVEALVLTSWDFKAMLRARPVVALDILPVVVQRFRKTAAELRRRTQGGLDQA